jgi:hypothetical protein
MALHFSRERKHAAKIELTYLTIRVGEHSQCAILSHAVAHTLSVRSTWAEDRTLRACATLCTLFAV